MPVRIIQRQVVACKACVIGVKDNVFETSFRLYFTLIGVKQFYDLWFFRFNFLPLRCPIHICRMYRACGGEGQIHKSVIDALSIGCLKPRKFHCRSWTKSEVSATGMLLLYPEVCYEVRMYPHAHFYGYLLIYLRGLHSVSFIYKGFPRTSNGG